LRTVGEDPRSYVGKTKPAFLVRAFLFCQCREAVADSKSCLWSLTMRNPLRLKLKRVIALRFAQDRLAVWRSPTISRGDCFSRPAGITMAAFLGIPFAIEQQMA
jgi:hypothetical protein